MSDEHSFSCVGRARSTANWRASCASWHGPAFSPAHGETCCSLRYHSMSEPPISTAETEKWLHDRRNARMDVVGAGRALGRCDVAVTSYPDQFSLGVVVSDTMPHPIGEHAGFLAQIEQLGVGATRVLLTWEPPSRPSDLPVRPSR